jgi:serine phosphatase RsbU (regulator of sigma subunit)
MSADRTDRPDPHLRVFTINVYVHDQDKALRFYVDQLGFHVTFDVQVQSRERWTAVSPPDGSALLMLIAPKPDSREYQLIGRPTGVVFLTDDPVAKYSDWVRRGVQFQYAPRLRRVRYSSTDENTWGGVFTHFKDVDGNTFALVGFDEVTRQIEAERRALGEKLEAERRAAQELEIAKQVQARLFPNSLPVVQTLEYAGACIQARQVGGDYFDFLDLGADRFGIMVGDIAGKGIAAALLMANLQANLRIHCAMFADQPHRLMRSVNNVFHKNTVESAYATLFFAEYVDGSRLLRYANCGHLPALLLRADGVLERLDSTATVVGLFGEWECDVGERTLSPGDILAIYTDGITESFNEVDEEFGEARLTGALKRYKDLPPEEMIARIIEEVQRFGAGEQRDDITLTIAKCR